MRHYARYKQVHLNYGKKSYDVRRHTSRSFTLFSQTFELIHKL